jgi:hypothetical protein
MAMVKRYYSKKNRFYFLFSRPMNLGSIGVLLAQKIFASIDDPEGK